MWINDFPRVTRWVIRDPWAGTWFFQLERIGLLVSIVVPCDWLWMTWEEIAHSYRSCSYGKTEAGEDSHPLARPPQSGSWFRDRESGFLKGTRLTAQLGPLTLLLTPGQVPLSKLQDACLWLLCSSRAVLEFHLSTQCDFSKLKLTRDDPKKQDANLRLHFCLDTTECPMVISKWCSKWLELAFKRSE